MYDKIRRILLRFGTIDDEAKKPYGPILVLNYGKDEQITTPEVLGNIFKNFCVGK